MSEEIHIKGNELAWVIKLAEIGYNDPDFQVMINNNNYNKLRDTIMFALGRFHSTNFNAGSSDITWKIMRIQDDES